MKLVMLIQKHSEQYSGKQPGCRHLHIEINTTRKLLLNISGVVFKRG